MKQSTRIISRLLIGRKEESLINFKLPSILTEKFYYQKKQIMTSSLDDIEKCKALAATAAVDENIKVGYDIHRSQRMLSSSKLIINPSCCTFYLGRLHSWHREWIYNDLCS